MAARAIAPRRVAVLGGGMAGLAAAWALSGPECRHRYEVTVYQRGWRLGGKGASSRGRSGRIEEHGLHVWLGYYDNAFALMRNVYEELGRPERDPACPVATFNDAFAQVDSVGVGDRVGDEWAHWVATFAANRLRPGIDVSDEPLPATTFLRRGARLLLDLSRSLGPAPAAPGVVLSSSPEPPVGRGPGLAELARQAETAALVAAIEAVAVAGAALPTRGAPVAALAAALDRLRADLLARASASQGARRAAGVADLVVTAIIGMLRDGLVADPADFRAIDHLDFREWLARHGAAASTLASPIVRGMYDLVFAYEDGDPDRPRFAAGLGLFLAGKLFFDYKGAIFWRMRAGMGDVVFAPLYEALRARGVGFAFFHRVERLGLAASGASVATVALGRQARLAAGQAEYDPLVRVRGLPCFPSAPLSGQLAGPVAEDVECAWADRTADEEVVLRAGADFDEIVLATSLGMLPEVAAELIDASPRWQEMVRRVATVPTQALQVWLREDERSLGWRHPGVAVSAYGPPFDTYASMSDLIEAEDWPDAERPRAIGYFCSALPAPDAADPASAHARVRANAVEHLERRVGRFWPGARSGDGGFRWELLFGADGAAGSDLLDTQHWQANVDPSDRYVQSLPDTGAARLRADESGFENVVLAGDWIRCGLDAGCIEAAVLAGLQAANVIRGRELFTGIRGAWYGFGARPAEAA